METNMDDKTVKADLMVVQLDRARTALAEAKTIGETKKVMDMAHAAQIYARRQQLGEEAMAYALAIKIEALRKLGEMLAVTQLATGGQPYQKKSTGSAKEPVGPTLEDLQITKKLSMMAQQLAKLEEDNFALVLDGKTTAAKALKAQKLGHKLERENDGSEEIFPEAGTQKAKAGQVWKLGDHFLMCGDAYNKKDVATLLKHGTKPDALIIDPPYGIGYQPDWKRSYSSKPAHGKIIGDDKPFDPAPFMEYPTLAIFGANHFSNSLPLGGWICWDKRDNDLVDDAFCAPFELMWFQSQHTSRRAIMIRCKHGGFVNADKDGKTARQHPTQKPIIVMEEVLKALTRSGETVLDLFAGSGPTLLACENTDRKCLAMEIDPKFVTVILGRWEAKHGISGSLVS